METDININNYNQPEEIYLEQILTDVKINQSELNPTFDTLIDFGELKNVFEEKKIDKEMYEKYPFINNKDILYDIQQYTKANKEVLESDLAKADAADLEWKRGFKAGTLQSRGVFYSDGALALSYFPSLKGTSSILNISFIERYQLPIKLPNGDVFTYMGYQPDVVENKYAFPRPVGDVDWARQSRVLGNLDSLGLYDGNEIYVVEGMMDAYRINEVFKKKSVATLAYKGMSNKINMLMGLKKRGHRLIAVPDTDITGAKSWMAQNKGGLFDKVYDINTEDPYYEDGKLKIFKDIDEKYKYIYSKQGDLNWDK